MRKIAFLGLALAMSVSLGCRTGTWSCFRGALCRPNCGLALPTTAPVNPGCNGCGTVGAGYGNYDGAAIGDGSVIGGDYYGSGVLGGDYYGGTIIPSAPSEGTLNSPMSNIENPN